MITAQELHGVMAMAPAFATPDADSLDATATIDVDNLAAGLDRIIKDGIPLITPTGSSGECSNLFWAEFKRRPRPARGDRRREVAQALVTRA